MKTPNLLNSTKNPIKQRTTALSPVKTPNLSETKTPNCNILSYYNENREDIITQLRKDLDIEHQQESDETLENWYKPNLLEIAKDWYNETLADCKLLPSSK